MPLEEIAWGTACLFVLVLNFTKTRHAAQVHVVALTLLACWVATVTLEHTLGDPQSLRYLPVIDLLGCIFSYEVWRRNRLPRIGLIVLVFALQCALHVLFRGRHDLSIDNQRAYVGSLNATFAAQLLLAALPGIKDGLGDRVLDCLFGPSPAARHRGHPRWRSTALGRTE